MWQKDQEKQGAVHTALSMVARPGGGRGTPMRRMAPGCGLITFCVLTWADACSFSSHFIVIKTVCAVYMFTVVRDVFRLGMPLGV